MTYIPLAAMMLLLALASIDQSMVNNLALLGIGLIGIYNAYKTKLAERKLELANRKLESVKKTTEATHTLSNSAMGAQLRINVESFQALSVVCHRLAETTHLAGDMAAATAADVKVKEHEALLQTHLIQQAKVDAEEAMEKKKLS